VIAFVVCVARERERGREGERERKREGGREGERESERGGERDLLRLFHTNRQMPRK